QMHLVAAGGQRLGGLGQPLAQHAARVEGGHGRDRFRARAPEGEGSSLLAAEIAAAHTRFTGTPAAVARRRQSSNSGSAPSTSPSSAPTFKRTRPYGVSASTSERDSTARSTGR